MIPKTTNLRFSDHIIIYAVSSQGSRDRRTHSTNRKRKEGLALCIRVRTKLFLAPINNSLTLYFVQWKFYTLILDLEVGIIKKLVRLFSNSNSVKK